MESTVGAAVGAAPQGISAAGCRWKGSLHIPMEKLRVGDAGGCRLGGCDSGKCPTGAGGRVRRRGRGEESSLLDAAEFRRRGCVRRTGGAAAGNHPHLQQGRLWRQRLGAYVDDDILPYTQDGSVSAAAGASRMENCRDRWFWSSAWEISAAGTPECAMRSAPASSVSGDRSGENGPTGSRRSTRWRIWTSCSRGRILLP